MSFTLQQPKKKDTKPGFPLVFIYSIPFLNNSQDNLVKNLVEIDFYHLIQEVNAIILDLIQKKGFFSPITTGVTFKNLKKAYIINVRFIMHWLIVKSMI